MRRSVATMDVNAVDMAPENNANATNTTANTADTNSVTASRFSAAWPAAANAAGASEREGATAAANGGVEEPATAEPQEAMPPVAPALAPADAAAAGLPSEPAPGLGHLLLFLSAVVAFIAIVVRSLLKLLSASRMQSEPRPAVQRAAPVIRTRSLERRASDHIGEPTTREGRPLRPLDIATRWDSVSRLPRTPSVPLYDDGTSEADAPLYADEGAALRRRRRVA